MSDQRKSNQTVAYLKSIFMWRESGSNLFDSNLFYGGMILVPNEFVF